MRIMVLALCFTAIGFSEAHARGVQWQSPGWYIVTATHNGAVIRDGQFPDASSCNEELSRRVARSRHDEYLADICIDLPQDINEPTQSIRSSASPPRTASPGLPVPRFASLKAGRVNVRRGPSHGDPLSWIYRRAGWPVEIIAEQDGWLHIRDRDGETGWIEAKFLDTARTCIFTGTRLQPIRARPDRDSQPLAWAEPDVLLTLLRCDARWCEIKGRNVAGFVERATLWGLLPNETID